MVTSAFYNRRQGDGPGLQMSGASKEEGITYLGDRCTRRGLPELSAAWRLHPTSEPRRQKVGGEGQLQNGEVETPQQC